LSGTDNAIGAEHALADIGNVHRAALSAIQAITAAMDLFHHADDITALGKAMSVTTVGTDDVVRIAEVLAYTNRYRLLPAVQVSEARNRTSGVLDMHTLFELADDPDLPVSLE
jgi:hypothetical protein